MTMAEMIVMGILKYWKLMLLIIAYWSSSILKNNCPAKHSGNNLVFLI